MNHVARPHGKACLAGVPAPLPLEAFTSWLSRAALSQGAGLWEFAKFLGISLKRDPDFWLPNDTIDRALDTCGLPATSFADLHRFFGSLRSITSNGEPFLARTRGRAQFRYCPSCLREQPTPYLSLLWRFIAWRWCPTHDCRLEDQCPKCKAALEGPIDLVATSSCGDGLLSRCSHCGERLHSARPGLVGGPDRVGLDAMETILLKNACAVLSALYLGRVADTFSEEPIGVAELIHLRRLGLLSHRFDWLSDRTTRHRAVEANE
ncbi:TniQ family protein [Caldimonas sp. KR1-144]|uniref:TniQ family protein n=1 Tax=Caldimonas sp. KR1-144 TaxID=3400911 RepID=UPI003C0A54B2